MEKADIYIRVEGSEHDVDEVMKIILDALQKRGYIVLHKRG